MKSVHLIPMLVGLACGVAACGANTSDEEVADPNGESALSTAPPSIVVPIWDEARRPLAQYNAKLRALQLPEYATTMEIKNQADAQKFFDLAMKFDDEIMTKVGAKKQALSPLDPGQIASSSRKNPGVCYKGNPLKVAEFVSSLASTLFSEQMNLYAWRYKKVKRWSQGMESDKEFEDTYPESWKDWRGAGEAVLVVTSVSDDGDERDENIIPKCR